MKQVLQLEELARTGLGIAVLYYQPIHMSWWLWTMLFLSLDISMLGYAINKRVGAISYNLFHNKGLAIAIAATGFYTRQPFIMLAGILLFAHSSFDRTMGYGFKIR